MKEVVQDVRTFITWWAMVQEKPSLLSKAKLKLGSWRLQDQHFKVGVWEAVAGLAFHTQPELAHITLTEDHPWNLPGLLPVLQTLEKGKCKVVAEWRRDWQLGEDGSVTPGMAALLKCSRPSTISLSLPDDQPSTSLPALPSITASLARTSCSLILMLEGDYVASNDTCTSDYLLLPFLEAFARVRLRYLACHLGIEAATKFFQEEAHNDSSEEDFPGVRHRPFYHATASIRYLEMLKVRISSLEVLVALNRALPHLELLDDLEVYLTLQGFVSSDDVPQLSYSKDRLTLRLDRITDSWAEWAGKVTAALSRQYAQVWLSWCHMTPVGGAAFLNQLMWGQTLVGAIHVFALSGRPNPQEFSALTVHAAQLPSHTALYW
ncbi:uncharacterized protein [Cherax quadricarinatus]|uniref:uncharacterized protein n=1 Tax=Cherax quadricarinatus TaxID=27406 RepID=UPI0023780DDD|nr:uncharacterized protein LOC128699464 [Cherax quadricarinatus]